MDYIPEPARFEQAKPVARRDPAGSLRVGVHARFETLLPADDLLPERNRLRIRPASLPMAAACLASTLAEGCTILAEESGAVRVVDDRTLAALVRQGALQSIAAVRIGAPMECVDRADLSAVARALRLGQDLFEADVRALWSLRAFDEELVLQSLDPAAPLSILSEAITGYAQEKLCEAGLPRLPRRFAGELLESVIVEIPPEETRVWDGFVEIGVRVGAGTANRDCERTILFDRPSRTWHLGE